MDDGAGPVIVRLWQGRVPIARADAYLDFLRARAIPDYRAIPGNLGVQLLLWRGRAVARVATLTHWSSWAAIRAFAGDDIARAKYYPEDAGFLLDFPPKVRHYEVAAMQSAGR